LSILLDEANHLLPRLAPRPRSVRRHKAYVGA
jgi:hypothetical protein